MRRQTARVLGVTPVAPAWVVRLALEVVPAAGQYLLADLGEPVREALFPCEVGEGVLSTVVAPGHRLAKSLPGTSLDVLGPLGRGFRLMTGPLEPARLLLVGTAHTVPVLQPLFEAASAVALVVEAATSLQVPAPSRFPPTLELTVVTLDGSAGYLGPLDDEDAGAPGTASVVPKMRELIAWAECICVALDAPRYRALARAVQAVRYQPQADFAQALVRVPMPCGAGVCDVCRVMTRHGEVHACQEGPVLDLMEFLA